MPASVPDRIGPYTPERLLGRGAAGAVYLCRSADGQPVALKWMEDLHPAMLRRFRREASILARVEHPAAARFRGFGEHDGRPWLAMEYVDGSDLRVYATKLHKRPSSERYERCRTIGRALCEVLDHLHHLGLVHRDVKPSNVLVEESGRVVLTDFGIARDLRERDPAEEQGRLIGTVGYAAPEQIDGEGVDARTDLFGLGATLYYLLTLHRPYDDATRSADAPPPLPSRFDPGIPPDLETAVLRMMALDAPSRYPDARAAARALEGGAAGGVPLAGRQQALAELTHTLDRVEAGSSLLLRPRGPRGAGQEWLLDLARQGAQRRGITCREQADALLLGAPPPEETVEIALDPLGLADVRRTVVAAAPLTRDPAQAAERLLRLTGGLPGLLVPLLDQYTQGGALDLPTDPPPPEAVASHLDDLDPDEIPVLGALAAVREPLAPDLVEALVQVPAAPALAALAARGVARKVDGGWALTAELFRTAAGSRVPDLDELGARLRALLARSPSRPDAAALLDQADVALSAGRLGPALDLARRATTLARAVGQRPAEARGLCLTGRLLLEVGRYTEARRTLADATALARAADDADTRRLSHVFRALATLDAAPGDRTAAAAAADRLMPLLAGSSHRPDDPVDALATAAWCRTTALLGDSRTSAREATALRDRLGALAPAVRRDVLLTLATAAVHRGDRAGTAEALRPLAPDSPLVAWRAACLSAVSEGTTIPEPPAVVLADLSPDDQANLRTWVIRLTAA